MGQADPFASRCSVMGCREQKILFGSAHGVALRTCRVNRARGKNREERKVWSPLFFILSFPTVVWNMETESSSDG
jgi:hypothetical protein